MKVSLRLVTLSFIVAVLLPVIALQPVSAQTSLSAEQLERISANCLSAKSTLNQLHASDALLRVNRGQIYESMASKLMNNFNSRLTNNNLDARGLLLVTNNYRTALESFRSNYQAYERQLSAAIRIDCDKQPAEFHVAVEDARDKRTKVHTDVIRLHQYIDDYRAAVSDFFINFERLSGSR